MAKRAWLMKTEPDAFSIDDLARVGIEPWTGVRNYMARNFMRDQMSVGDDVLFYHSSCEPPGVAGLARIERTGVVDETQFDPASKYYDEDSKRDEPRWICVDVAYVKTFPGLVPLEVLRRTEGLDDMVLLQRGSRLSVQPVSDDEYRIIVAMGETATPLPPTPPKKARPAAARPAPARKKAAAPARKAKPAAAPKKKPAAAPKKPTKPKPKKR
jgi:predicted RNA-binding protein with PUA-like domain